MLEGRKRLPAEVIRTLESIYDRTPFPSNDVIKCAHGSIHAYEVSDIGRECQMVTRGLH